MRAGARLCIVAQRGQAAPAQARRVRVRGARAQSARAPGVQVRQRLCCPPAGEQEPRQHQPLPSRLGRLPSARRCLRAAARP